MSTRTNIVIKDKNLGMQFFIYRHHDGYPAYPGADVLEINKMHSATEAIRYLLTKEDARYEMTDDIHGDIEHLYIVEVNNGKIYYGCDGYGTEITAAEVTRTEFAEIVNADRMQINNYIKNRYDESEWDLFEMVEA